MLWLCEMYDMRNEGNIVKFYLFNMIGGGLFFAIPVLVLFWQENGLSLTEVMLLQSIYAIIIVLLEVPSGYFSDKIGRRVTMIISSVLGSFSVIFYAIGHGFFEFLIAEVFLAIAFSFQSGTLSAFLYDSLAGLGREKEYRKIFGRATFYGGISLAFSNVLGGFLGKIDLRYPVYASIPFFLLMIAISLFMYEPEREKKIKKTNYFKDIFLLVKKEFKNKKLRWIIIYSATIGAFNGAAIWIYQPYFKITGLDIIYFGMIYFSFEVIAAFAAKYAQVIEDKIGEKTSFLMLGFLVSVSYILMSNFIFLFSFSFAFMQQFVKGFKNVIVTDYINKVTPQEWRATMLSIESLVNKLFYALLIPLIGWWADVYTLENALEVVGITISVLSVIFLLIFKKLKI